MGENEMECRSMRNNGNVFEEWINAKYLGNRLNLFTTDDLNKIAKMSSKERRQSLLSWCSEEELDNLENELLKEEYSLDSTMLLQFALEDLGISVERLSEETRIDKKYLTDLLSGKLLPWKLKVDQVVTLLQILGISINEFTKGLRQKRIIVRNKDVNIEGVQLPRAKSLTKREQKRAMIEMEKQIMVHEEMEEREEFIQRLTSFVSR